MKESGKTEDNSVGKNEDKTDEATKGKGPEELEESSSHQETGKESVEQDTYTMDEKGTFKNGAMIANFKLTILLIWIMVDVDEIVQRLYKMVATLNGRETCFTMTAEEFSTRAFMPAIYREVGPDAILYGSPKDLLIAVQEKIFEKVPEKKISLSTGFTKDYKEFLLPGMRITSEGIEETDEPVVDLSNGNLARKINFSFASDEEIKQLMQHLLNDFAALKSDKIMLPVLGHVALAPFSSWIVGELGRQKYVLHLKGPSGGGKTFIARLIGSFFGNFGDQITSWSGTANSIEMEGYGFRDLPYILDDHKGSVILKKEVIRVVQNHADNRGRGRLNSSLKLQKTPHIRGLLLSTGEDYVEDVESVSGRTIILDVEPKHDEDAGKACRDMRNQYKGFIPRLVQRVISPENWQDNLKTSVNIRIEDFSASVTGISNGLRIATNWALNAAGFELFIKFAHHVGAIDCRRCEELMERYEEIVEDHLKSNQDDLLKQNPAALCWNILEHQIATESVIIDGLVELNKDKSKVPSSALNRKIIGTLSKDKKSVYLFPDLMMKHLVRHYKELDQSIPFDKGNLRDALVREGLIIPASGSRIAKQVRHNGGRVQAWQFDLAEFKKQCVDAEDA